MAMPDFQWYPWNHNRIKTVEDNVVFLALKAFNSDNFCIASHDQKKMRISFPEKSQIKIPSWNIQKHGYLIHTWSDNVFKEGHLKSCVQLKTINLSWELEFDFEAWSPCWGARGSSNLLNLFVRNIFLCFRFSLNQKKI